MGYFFTQRLFDRSVSGKVRVGSISMDETVDASATTSDVRRAPFSHTSTGMICCSVAPVVRVIVSRTGIGASPLSSMVTRRPAPSGSTDCIAWSSVQVSNHHVLQNHDRSWLEHQSKVFQKSYGVGCLFSHRWPN